MHENYLKNPSSISVRGLSAEYGAYVGEVIRRNKGNAYWTRDSDVGGEKSYPLHWNAGESYPFAWCSRRIIDGEGDSIWFKYSVLKDPTGNNTSLGWSSSRSIDSPLANLMT